MCGFFGDLFDLDGDGSLDAMEKAMEYTLLDEIINEDEKKEGEDKDERKSK